MTIPSLYPYDPSGVAAANLVGGVTPESHTFVAEQGNRFTFIIPNAAPFFRTGFVLKKVVGSIRTTLVEGVDFVFVMPFWSATDSLGKPIFGGISFINQGTAGTVEMRYQTLGGDWTLDDVSIATQMVNDLYNPKVVYWEQINGKPDVFPPGPHEQPLSDFKGFDDLIDKIEEVRQDMLAAAMSTSTAAQQLVAHMTAGTSHTAAQVGLGAVQNYGLATVPEAQAGIVTNKYMTPKLTQDAMTALIAGRATKLATARTITINSATAGNGSASFDGTANITITLAGGAVIGDWNTLTNRPADLLAGATLNPARLPAIPANLVTGLLAVGNIPSLDASLVTTGTFLEAVIPVLTTTKIPVIDISAKTSGILPVTRGGTGGSDAATGRAGLGLDLLNNYATATAPQTVTGTATNLFTTPAGVKAAINAGRALTADSLTNTFIVNVTGAATGSFTSNGTGTVSLSLTQTLVPLNKGGTGATDALNARANLGLDQIQNYGIATSPEAMAGTINNKYMTPLRTKELVDQVIAAGNFGSAGYADTAGTATLANTADKWTTARTITMAGDATGSVVIDGSANVTLTIDVTEASKLATARTISATGDATGTLSFDGTSNVSMALTLATVSIAKGGTGATDATNARANLGLGSVQNYGIAATLDATTGTSNALYMTPVRVKEAIGALNSATTTKLATARTIACSGDVTGTTTFDGSANVTIAMTLGTVSIAKGGTGATDAAGARTGLGLGSISTWNVHVGTGAPPTTVNTIWLIPV